MGGFYIKKICKHVSHFDPQKDPETWVEFIENRVKKSWRKFWKIGRPTYFEKKLAKSLNKHGSPFSFVLPKTNRLGFC